MLDGDGLRRRGGATAADAFLDVAGLDAEGVGPAQRRPVVRGMRGQRVLLLEDGLRLNNVRRRVDSGEPTGLAWLDDVGRVEVVRGPASVLYGSDALGGVVNVVSRPLDAPAGRVRGRLVGGLRSAGSASSLSGSVSGAVDGWSARLSGGAREAGPYRAPAGTFGDLTLPEPVEVHDSGAHEESLGGRVGWSFGTERSAFLSARTYRSRDSGFGWVDPSALGDDPTTTRLWWPRQDFERVTAGVRLGGLGMPIADRADVTLYAQRNGRTFLTEVAAPLPGPEGARLDVHSENFTDLRSRGIRVELRRLVAAPLLVTYGLDAYEDRSAGTDSSATTVSGLGPPTVTGRVGPQVPDAHLRNVGLFAQGELAVTPSTRLVAGVRYQDVRARTLPTRGNDAAPVTYRDRTLVGAVSGLRRLGRSVTLVASVARGFRTPDLVERFFTGLTGDGRGWWEANPDLRPETSLDVELGVRLHADALRVEAFAFHNALAHGIVLEPTGETVGRAVVYRNVNVDELLFRGIEGSVELALPLGLTVEANGTALDVRDRRDPARVLAESYPNKLGLALRYHDPGGRFTARWGLRRNGGAPAAGATPVGSRVPSFIVQDLDVTATAWSRHRVIVAVDNLTDALYAEALNTGFFRPEPGRRLAVRWEVAF